MPSRHLQNCVSGATTPHLAMMPSPQAAASRAKGSTCPKSVAAVAGAAAPAAAGVSAEPCCCSSSASCDNSASAPSAAWGCSTGKCEPGRRPSHTWAPAPHPVPPASAPTSPGSCISCAETRKSKQSRAKACSCATSVGSSNPPLSGPDAARLQESRCVQFGTSCPAEVPTAVPAGAIFEPSGWPPTGAGGSRGEGRPSSPCPSPLGPPSQD